MELYAVGTTTGLVIDIGYEKTDITPILDTVVQYHATVQLNIGARDLDFYLAHLLSTDREVLLGLSPSDGAPALTEAELDECLLSLAIQLKHAGHLRVHVEGQINSEANEDELTDVAAVLAQGREKAVIEARSKKKADAAAGIAKRRVEEDKVEVVFRGKTVVVGPIRLRFSEPLLDCELLKGIKGIDQTKLEDKSRSVPEGVEWSINQVDHDKRASLWENVVITGGISRIRGQ